jgi:hypothetical protein
MHLFCITYGIYFIVLSPLEDVNMIHGDISSYEHKCLLKCFFKHKFETIYIYIKEGKIVLLSFIYLYYKYIGPINALDSSF